MKTYWDVVPRDIWWLVFGYAAPRLEHPKSWPKTYYTGQTTKLPKFLQLKDDLLILVAWMEDKIEDPVSHLVARYFLEPRSWTLDELVLNLYQYYEEWSGLYQITFLVKQGFAQLAREIYQLAVDFSRGKPLKRAYNQEVCRRHPSLCYLTRQDLMDTLNYYLIMAAMQSQRRSNFELVESLMGNVWLHSRGIQGLEFDLTGKKQILEDYSAESILWLKERTNPIYHSGIIQYALSRNLVEVLEKLVPSTNWSLWSCHEILMSKAPIPADRKYVRQLLSQVIRFGEIECVLDLIKWTALHSDHPYIEEWIEAIGQGVDGTQEQIHRLITRLIRNPPIFRIGAIYPDPCMVRSGSGLSYDHRLPFLRVLYQRFLAIFDRPELLYSSYALLKRSDLFPDAQIWLRPLIQEGLARGQIRQTRHFP